MEHEGIEYADSKVKVSIFEFAAYSREFFLTLFRNLKYAFFNTAFLMQSYRMHPERIGALSGFADAHRNALVTCTGRRYNGGGYSQIDFVQGIMIFAPRKDAY